MRFMKCFCWFITTLVLFNWIVAGQEVREQKAGKKCDERSSPKIVWSTEAVNETLFTGTAKVREVSFSCNSALSNVRLVVVPELARFVTVTPSSFAQLSPGQANTISIFISVPETTRTKLFKGTIHVVVGNKVYPQTLKMSVNVVPPGSLGVPATISIPSLDRLVYDTTNGVRLARNELLVAFNLSADTSYAQANIRQCGGAITGYDNLLKIYQIQPQGNLTAEQLKNCLEANPKVQFCGENFFIKSFFTRKAPPEWNNLTTDKYYHFDLCKFPDAWYYQTGQPTVKIGIIDYGFDIKHNDLKNLIEKTFSIAPGSPEAWPSDPQEAWGHGTAIAGILAAEGENYYSNNNPIGIAGATWKSILFFYNFVQKYDDSHAYLSNTLAAQALVYAIMNDNAVINCSFGYEQTDPNNIVQASLLSITDFLFSRSIDVGKLFNKDFLVVCSAGNSGIDAKYCSPANLSKEYKDNVISVASVDKSANLWTGDQSSNWGNTVNVGAPGLDIYTTAFGNTYETLWGCGTSQAAPIVSGLAALLWSQDPTRTAAEVKKLIVDGARRGGMKVKSTHCEDDNLYVINALESVHPSAKNEYVPDANTVALWHLNETCNNTVFDATSNHNDGTATGTTILDGKFQEARGFNGTSDVIQIPDSPSLAITEALTLEAWIYIRSTLDRESAGIICKGGTDLRQGYELLVTADNGMKIYFSAGYPGVQSATPLSTNQWYHVAGTFDGQTLRIYVNGTLDGSATTPAPYSLPVYSNPALIGQRDPGNNGARYFNGIIDEVRISNKPRTPEEFSISQARIGSKIEENLGSNKPTSYAILQNFPNPFNPATVFKYELPASSHISLRIFDLLGQVVSTLVDEKQDAGLKSVDWNAGDISSGIYFYRLEAVDVNNPSNSFVQTKKMILLK